VLMAEVLKLRFIFAPGLLMPMCEVTIMGYA